MFESFETIFGIKIQEKEIGPIKDLPIYMISKRNMFEIELGTGHFIVVCISEFDRFGAVALKKQLTQYEEFFKSHVAFSFSGVTKIQRDSLIKHGIPFVALPTQVYLPFLGIMLSDSYKKESTLSLDKMMPATQSLYLYLLYQKFDGISKMTAADELKLTRMSITRASNQLDGMNLITQKKVGKNIYMKANAYGKQGYELAISHLINPTQKTILVKDCEALINLPFAGETALAAYSMLEKPMTPTKAISKDSPIISKLERVDEKWNSNNQYIRLQLWKYDPILFSKDKIVDRISLAMSFEDNIDERIEDAIDMCLEALND